MTKVILEITDQEDLQLILVLLKRMGISHSISGGFEQSLTEEERIEYGRIIDQGAPATDLDQRLKDLEEDRTDRELPYRNA